MKQKFTLLLAICMCLIAQVFAQNVALNKTGVASTGNAAAALDGNVATRWESAQGAGVQWMYVDLGAQYDINQIKIIWEAAGGKDFLVQKSDDALTWTTIRDITGNTLSTNDYTGLTETGRFVRIYCTVRQLPWGYSIWELEVYGTIVAGANFAPSVNLTAPNNNATFNNPATINIAATATDTDGTIAKVEFYNGTTKLGEDLIAPYEYSWTNVPAGNYSVTARAYDNTGDFTLSSARNVNVQLPVIVPACGGMGLDNDYTYKFSFDNDNPTITFIPNPNRPTVGNSTLIFYYGTSPTDPLPGIAVTPNVAYPLTAAEGTLIYFYYTYNSPSGEKNNNANRFQFTVGSCATVNLALNQPAVASSNTTNQQAALAFDGNSNGGSRWESLQADPQWIYVDLGESFDITNVNITWETALGKDYEIQVSDDTNSWTTIETVTGNTALQNNLPVIGSGRYVRMYGTARGTGFGYSIFEMVINGMPHNTLPVSLINFESKLQTNGQVALNWSTASEFNNSHFIVERSTDGKTFNKIAQVASKNGNSNTRLNYSYIDATPQQGVNYYKLTQVDLNGSNKSLGIQSQTVEINAGNSTVYPNPLKGSTLYITLPSKQDGQVAISITSLSGNSVYNGLENVVSGNASISLSSKPAPGLYIVRAEGQAFKLIVE